MSMSMSHVYVYVLIKYQSFILSSLEYRATEVLSELFKLIVYKVCYKYNLSIIKDSTVDCVDVKPHIRNTDSPVPGGVR